MWGARSILIEPFRWANSAALAYAGSGKLCRVVFKGHTTLIRPMSMLLNRMRNEIPMDSALTKICLARQMLLYRREGLFHPRNVQRAYRGDAPCFPGASLRSVPADIQGINGCGIQTISRYGRREPGRHRCGSPADTGCRDCEIAVRQAPAPRFPVPGSSSADGAAASGRSATVVDQFSPHPNAATSGRGGSF
jgi:hypothetical protein